ncbi:MAG: right-handed parallel beta-helix repeat-containing protein [Planctomycetota bacterium]
MRRLSPVRAAVTVLILTCGSAGAATWHVPQDVPTIQGALDLARSGDTIFVAPGTYRENISFLGKAVVLKGVKGPAETIIRGLGTGSVVMFIQDEPREAVLDGFTITGGRGTWAALDRWGGQLVAGGAIFSHKSSPTIRGNVITENELAYYSAYGGGIYCGFGSEPLIVENTIRGNRCGGGAGGGIACRYSSPTILRNTIHQNQVDAWDTDGHGGGIYCEESQAVIEENLISANSVDGAIFGGKGGGIACVDSSCRIRANRIGGNTALSCLYGTSSGGGIYCEGGAPEILDNLIQRNEANGCDFAGGGGIYCGNVGGLIARNSLRANRVSAYYDPSGGGLYLSGTTPVVRQNLIAENEATWGGGVYLGSADETLFTDNVVVRNLAVHAVASPVGGGVCIACTVATIENNTIAENRSYVYGGGVGILWSQRILLKGSILWGNRAPHGSQVSIDSWVAPGRLLLSHCDVEGGEAGIEEETGNAIWSPGNLDADPLFTGPASDDFSLSRSSPCIDTGGGQERTTELDYAGNPRCLDGLLEGSAIIDMGAHEFDNVHLAISGDATPGGELVLMTSGTAGLGVALLVGSPSPGGWDSPLGALFVDLTKSWWLFALGTIPDSGSFAIQGPVPEEFPPGAPVMFQEMALDSTSRAGNSSNPVEIVIE